MSDKRAVGALLGLEDEAASEEFAEQSESPHGLEGEAELRVVGLDQTEHVVEDGLETEELEVMSRG